MKNFDSKIFVPAFDNTVDPFIPEIWATESLMVLYKNVLAVNLVHRDFENEVAQFGDTVNTRRPAKFVAKKKIDSDNVTNQNADSTNVAVLLNQHLHVSFTIKDGEESKGMKSLVSVYLEPALEAIAQGLEEVVLGERYNFLDTTRGQLDAAPTIDIVNDLYADMTDNLAPLSGRRVITSSTTKAQLSSISTFHEADKVGDDGTALREGSIGRKLGFDWYMSQNSPKIAATDTTVGALDLAGTAGDIEINVDGLSAAIVNGSWLTVAGDMTPQLVTGSTGGATPSAINISPGLANDVVDNAVVTIYDPVLVNNGAGYASGWVKEFAIDSATIAPKAGQLASVGAASVTAAVKYGIMTDTSTTSLLLNRGLEAAVADNATIGLGPAGSYNWAFHRNAVALVTRPLAIPMEGVGARGFVQDLDGLSVRVVISYDSIAQGHRVTVDVLAGVKTLDVNLGAVLLG